MSNPTKNLPGDRQTLAGLFTPVGEGGIGLIELIGPQAAAILDRLFQNQRRLRLSAAQSDELLYGKLIQNGELLDEVIVEIVGLAVGSTENGAVPRLVVNCHGGIVAAQRVLAALEAEGARIVDPGEILAMRQAAGDLDAIQREVAARLPQALTLRAAAVLIAQYQGTLVRVAISIRHRIETGRDRSRVEADLQRLLDTAAFGRGLFSPMRVVVAGRPNVGKSTLINALLRFERVIVHPTAGTTRDAIEDIFSIEGVPFRLVDTAGIRPTRNAVEREGVERGISELTRADIAILTFDGSMPLQSEDDAILTEPLPSKVIPVINKADLPQQIAATTLAERLDVEPAIISATEGTGLQALEDRILKIAYPNLPAKGEAVLFTERQEELVRKALAACVRGSPAQAIAHLDRMRQDPWTR